MYKNTSLRKFRYYDRYWDTFYRKVFALVFCWRQIEKDSAVWGKSQYLYGGFAKICQDWREVGPEKPCPWHAEMVVNGRLTIRYCDVGGEGHEGGHLGDRSRDEYLRRLRVWRAFRHQERRKTVNGSSDQSNREVVEDGLQNRA